MDRVSETHLCRLVGVLAIVALGVTSARAQEPIDRRRDRGDGQPTDMFGTYIRGGELLVYPFYEYYRDKNYEYKPEDLGFIGTDDLRGGYRASEGLIYIGYGLSDRVAVELEVATIRASLWKSAEDRSGLPARLSEAGLGDTGARVRWRWNRESDRRPEVFSFFETGFPFQRHRALIGTQNWEFAFGTGVVRGYSWGTITARATILNDGGNFEPGEYAFEYLRRLSSRVRVYAGIEGTQDEAELITEGQIFLTPNVFLKLNNAFGMTSKAPDWAPEVGVMFSIPTR
jgi:hypothetical protein